MRNYCAASVVRRLFNYIRSLAHDPCSVVYILFCIHDPSCETSYTDSTDDHSYCSSLTLSITLPEVLPLFNLSIAFA